MREPKFDLVHYCRMCKTVYNCPDRFDFGQCHVEAGWTKMGHAPARAISHPCTPCIASFNDTNRAAWYAANGVEGK